MILQNKIDSIFVITIYFFFSYSLPKVNLEIVVNKLPNLEIEKNFIFFFLKFLFLFTFNSNKLIIDII